MMSGNAKSPFQEVQAAYYNKLDEVRAYGKAHSPEDRNGQEFKSKMKQYREELHDLVNEKTALLNVK